MGSDPRETWANLQKNLQRMQQQGKRYDIKYPRVETRKEVSKREIM